ncbi:DUF551 domain-containing protein [Salmonella enterica]|nr:DUF551 domain-containing protein [Salmonella enterica]
MTTITREQQKQILIDTANHVISRDNTSPYSENLRELARIALASLEAKPVAYIFKHPAGKLFWALTDESNKEQPDVIPVYADSPAPVVPDEIDVNDVLGAVTYFKTHRDCYADGWNACRAAMLQTGNFRENKDSSTNNFRKIAETSTNSPVITVGWISCSERMPPTNVAVLVCVNGVVQKSVFCWDGESWGDWYDEYDELAQTTFTHWMPLPEPPQEVNRG